MTINILSILLFTGVFLLIFGVGELLHHIVGVDTEYTRKWSHIGAGLVCLAFPLYSTHPIEVILLCGSFCILLILSKRYAFLQSINGVDRDSLGGPLFPIAIILCFCVQYWYQNVELFYIPVLVMTISDTLASLVGKRYPWQPYSLFGNHKTISGSLAFFCSAFVISILHYTYIPSTVNVLISAFAISGIATVAEALSWRGFDNIVIPLVIILLLMSM